MSVVVSKPKSKTKTKARKRAVVLRTPEEAEAYIRKNLKPAGYSPSGLPFYKDENLKKLDMRFKL